MLAGFFCHFPSFCALIWMQKCFFFGRQGWWSKVDVWQNFTKENQGVTFQGWKSRRCGIKERKEKWLGRKKMKHHINTREKNPPHYNVLLFHQLLHQGWINEWRTGTGRSPLSPCLSLFLKSNHPGRHPPLVTSTDADPLMIQHQTLQSASLWPAA